MLMLGTLGVSLFGIIGLRGQVVPLQRCALLGVDVYFEEWFEFQ